MILVRSPLRVSFFGGGSDLPQFYRKEPGAVLSVTINKFIYIAVNRTPYQDLKLMYSEIEVVKSIDAIRHPLIREALRHFDVRDGLEIGSFADIPTRGTGMGSSSCFTVGLLRALAEITGRRMTRFEIADLACDIEINRCGEPIGRQDQYAVAFGGLNFLRFQAEDTVDVVPVRIDGRLLDRLQSNLMMFYTGRRRSASSVLAEQSENVATSTEKFATTRRLAEMAIQGHDLLSKGRLDDFGRLLHDGWELKKSLASSVSDNELDSAYERAMKAGALGGKILGAGGGGYFLFYVPADCQESVQQALPEFQKFDFRFHESPCETAFK